jgi:lysozyme
MIKPIAYVEIVPSEDLASFIKSWEQCRLKSYLPTSDDVPTIGWGTTGKDIVLGMEWSQEEADYAFAEDLYERSQKLNAMLAGTETTQMQFDAMLSLMQNVGVRAFETSTLLSRHFQGSHALAADQFLRWDKQRGKVLGGLTRRREQERQIYLGDLRGYRGNV